MLIKPKRQTRISQKRRSLSTKSVLPFCTVCTEGRETKQKIDYSEEGQKDTILQHVNQRNMENKVVVQYVCSPHHVPECFLRLPAQIQNILKSFKMKLFPSCLHTNAALLTLLLVGPKTVASVSCGDEITENTKLTEDLECFLQTCCNASELHIFLHW